MAKGESKRPAELEYTPANCHARDVLARIGDKWSVYVIHVLGDAQTLRFNELRSQVDGISQRMLTVTLRGMERDGLVSRKVFPEVPPRVEYALTPLGATLRQMVRALVAWSGAHVAEVDAARAAYDARNGKKSRPTVARPFGTADALSIEPQSENIVSPLDGVRVVDFTQVMGGPFCTMQLGDLGADVIKVEPPGGDLSRSMGGAALEMPGGDNAPFFALNRNKRSIVLDLKQERGRAVALALARTADVIVESARPGVMKRLGVDYETLSAINPRIIYASISGFGQTGPYADRPGFDLIAQGMSGVMSVTGEPGGSPVKTGVPIADLAVGLIAVNGILAALIARGTTGRGQYIETSLFESALAMSVWEATEYWATGEAPRAMGSAHRLSAPYQAFRTSDGYITLAALTTLQWQRLCATLDRDAMASDPRFETNAARMSHRPALVQEIEAALASDTTASWVERMLAAGVPAGPIYDLAQVFADPHTHARHMIEDIDHPVAGRVHTLGFPLKMSGTPPRVRRPPPLLGEHTAEILRELDQL